MSTVPIEALGNVAAALTTASVFPQSACMDCRLAQGATGNMPQAHTRVR